MKITDLSHPMHERMPIFPGTPAPRFTLPHTIEKDGFQQSRLNYLSHIGTHIDAPAHIIQEGKCLGDFSVDKFTGSALRFNADETSSEGISIAQLEPLAEQLGKVDFLLLFTGWSRYWGDSVYFKGFPVLQPETSRWLLQFPLKGIGVDTISFDPEDSRELPIHHILLEREILLIENLTGLEKISQTRFLFCGFPLHYPNADGSPIRAVAVEE